jgi:hypothetical protein
MLLDPDDAAPVRPSIRARTVVVAHASVNDGRTVFFRLVFLVLVFLLTSAL